MDIRALGGGSALDPNSLKEMLRGKNAREEFSGSSVALAERVQPPVRTEAFPAEKNYARINLSGMQAENTQANRQNAVLNAAMTQLDTGGSYAQRALSGRKAARNMMREMERTVAEESERNLEEGRDAIAAKVEDVQTASSEGARTQPATETAAPETAAGAAAAPESGASPQTPAPTPSIDSIV